MTVPSPSFWQKSYIGFSIAGFALFFWHAGDDVFRGEVNADSATTLAIGTLIFGVLFVFGLLWSWRHQVYGYWIVLILSVMSFWGAYLSHALGAAGSHGLIEMASKTGAWAPVMVATSLICGVSSATAIILAMYLLIRSGARQG